MKISCPRFFEKGKNWEYVPGIGLIPAGNEPPGKLLSNYLKSQSGVRCWKNWIGTCTESDCVCQIHDRSFPFPSLEVFDFEFSKGSLENQIYGQKSFPAEKVAKLLNWQILSISVIFGAQRWLTTVGDIINNWNGIIMPDPPGTLLAYFTTCRRSDGARMRV